MPQPSGVDTKPGISVVIPTYGRDRVLVDTVQALLALAVPPGEIVLADQTQQHDAETEQQLVAWARGGRINWLRLHKPSIPCAMNQGLLAARWPLVLFLDDDIVPDDGLVAAHLRAHREQSGGLLAGRVLQPWHEGQPDLPNPDSFGFNSLQPRKVSDFMGGNFSLLRDAALEIGGFDENFVRVAYRFEAEFAHRWRQSGQRIRYEPAALIHHLKIASGGTRTFGEHLKAIGPSHTVGAYYYLLRTKRIRAFGGILIRMLGSVKTRHHLKRPWWIPATLIAEFSGLLWALLLAISGPRHVDGASYLAGRRSV